MDVSQEGRAWSLPPKKVVSSGDKARPRGQVVHCERAATRPMAPRGSRDADERRTELLHPAEVFCNYKYLLLSESNLLIYTYSVISIFAVRRDRARCDSIFSSRLPFFLRGT